MMVRKPKACPKFCQVGADEFVRHINKDKCPQCLALLRYLERELQIAYQLWLRRN
jgi:hypothetical protein